jgi:hypothetical protein
MMRTGVHYVSHSIILLENSNSRAHFVRCQCGM